MQRRFIATCSKRIRTAPGRLIISRWRLKPLNDTKGAEDALRDAIDIDPKLAKIRAELGRLELAEGDLQSAQKWLESALDLEPELVEARGNLAMVYARKGDLVSAEKLLRQALEDDPNYKEGHLNLGLILAQQNRKSDAEKELDKAVALAPKDPATLSAAGKAKLQMGKVSEGIALLQQGRGSGARSGCSPSGPGACARR